MSNLHILLTSVGRRVSLVKFFKEEVGEEGLVFSADCDPTAPGLYVADRGFIVPRVTDAEYISSLLHICEREKVRLIVPLIDPELPVIAKAREEFLKIGTIPLVSTYDVVMTGYDKLLTAAFFERHGIPTPKTFLFDESLRIPEHCFPVIVKPRFGSASSGVHRCDSMEEVRFYALRIYEPIVQEFLRGEEITVDVLCDFQGNPLSIVQRKRLKVRAGEVERGVTLKDSEIFEVTLRVVHSLKPFGVINLQGFRTSDGFFFTEINPRFGGGYPLSHYAGANFPRVIVSMLRGETLSPAISDYKEGVLMLRYDEAIYITEKDLLC